MFFDVARDTGGGNDEQPVLRPLTEAEKKPAAPAPAKSERKDLRLFWFAFPVLYIFAAGLGILTVFFWWSFFLFPAFTILLVFCTKLAITAETGIQSGKKLALYLILLWLLYPVGIIMYANLRKKCGLSDVIMPWAIWTAILFGLVDVIAIVVGIAAL